MNSAGSNVTGLDRFGRIADQVWERYGDDPAVLDEYTYTYDRAGNRTSQTNVLNGDLSETYDYDAVDRLATWAVGGTTQKTWSLDALGNDLSAGTYNAANEETPTSGNSGYDAAGNMTTLQSGDTARYDAWNRMVEVDSSSGIVEKYEYDGTNRRIQIFSGFDTNGNPTTVEDDYLNGQQVVESDTTVNSARAGGYQYLWSPRYEDAPILRDTLNSDGTIQLAQRVFYLADANYNVTGLVKQDSGSGEWQVAERYTYDPYGVVTVRYGNDGAGTDWDQRVGGTAYANTVLYTGRTLDSTGLYYYRARYYDAGLERFVSRDPIGYRGGDDLYEYVKDSPLIGTDPTGLSCMYVAQGNGVTNPPGPPGKCPNPKLNKACDDALETEKLAYQKLMGDTVGGGIMAKLAIPGDLIAWATAHRAANRACAKAGRRTPGVVIYIPVCFFVP